LLPRGIASDYSKSLKANSSRLCQSFIKCEHIGDAARREWGGKVYALPSTARETGASFSKVQMPPYLVVILHVRQQHVTEVSLAEHNNVVEAFPSNQPIAFQHKRFAMESAATIANAH
jgi:hypothetical protein